MMGIIGRKREQETLKRIYQSKKAEFVAVYGRRRIGKTYLIKTFFAAKKGCLLFHITGIKEGRMQDQLYEFTRIVESTFYASQLQLREPANWTQAFELLTNTLRQQNRKGPIILFFDELPWLASHKSGFMQALDYYWNRFWVNMAQIKLIVSGSAAAWIIEKIFHDKGGLHNRVTERILLDPLNLQETDDYLKARGFTYTLMQVLDLYLVIGGIPYYLELLRKDLSVPQNIDELCFHRKGALVEEFKLLYASLFYQADAYEELIRLIAQKRKGIERRELLQQAKLSSDGGTFNQRLQELEASGFIASFKPYGFKKRGIYYHVIDEYTLFYMSWIEPALDTIKRLNKPNRYWQEKSQTAGWLSWAGYAFEAVCYKHSEQIREALGINASAAIGSWQYIPKKGSEEEGAQIDLLFDRNDQVITVCEIKYTREPYRLTKPEAQQLIKKQTIFKKRTLTTKQLQQVLIASQPMRTTIYTEDIIEKEINLMDLMSE